LRQLVLRLHSRHPFSPAQAAKPVRLRLITLLVFIAPEFQSVIFLAGDEPRGVLAQAGGRVACISVVVSTYPFACLLQRFLWLRVLTIFLWLELPPPARGKLSLQFILLVQKIIAKVLLLPLLAAGALILKLPRSNTSNGAAKRHVPRQSVLQSGSNGA
jgi:hypothetical protein